MTRRSGAAAVAGLLLLAGCSGDPTGGDPTTGAPGGGARGGIEEVGETVASWDEWDGGEELDASVGEIEAVLRTQEEYEAWLDSLPLSDESVAQLTTDIDFGAHVAVTGAHFHCFSYLALLTDGAGGVDTRNVQHPADEGTDCDSSPVRIAVVVATLDELGVGSADDVHRDTTIGDER